MFLLNEAPPSLFFAYRLTDERSTASSDQFRPGPTRLTDPAALPGLEGCTRQVATRIRPGMKGTNGRGYPQAVATGTVSARRGF